MPVGHAPTELDTETWAQLHRRMRQFIGRRVTDAHAADDIAQEVLVSLHRNLGRLRSADRLDAFTYRIARNAITDHYRRVAGAKELPVTTEDVGDRLDAVAAADSPDDTAGRRQLARCLAPLVDRLAEPYREALLMTDLGELSQAEAARQLGLSIPGMKSRVQRARSTLGDMLASCCAVSLDAGRQIADVERVGPCACTASSHVRDTGRTR